MRLKVISINSVVKAINKARVTGKLSLVAITKLKLLQYYIYFAAEQLDFGIEEYKAKYDYLVKRYNDLVYSCPDLICNVLERDCSTKTYESTAVISNPYKPVSTVVPDPEEPVVENLPPTIGDNTIIVDNNVTTILNIAMFTSDTTAAYSDPEGDLIDAIRIDSINSTNQGIFYVLGFPISEGQIITREQIIAEEFTHVGTDVATIASDSFQFSARDEGSLTWVQ